MNGFIFPMCLNPFEFRAVSNSGKERGHRIGEGLNPFEFRAVSNSPPELRAKLIALRLNPFEFRAVSNSATLF